MSQFNIHRKDTGVKTIYHEIPTNNIFNNLMEEFLSKKHPKRRYFIHINNNQT